MNGAASSLRIMWDWLTNCHFLTKSHYRIIMRRIFIRNIIWDHLSHFPRRGCSERRETDHADTWRNMRITVCVIREMQLMARSMELHASKLKLILCKLTKLKYMR